MTPLQIFHDVWGRTNLLAAIHGYVKKNGTAVLQPGEILRAEWVARVSALDLYVHELVAQRMLGIFAGSLAKTEGYNKFKVTLETTFVIHSSSSAASAQAAFDLDVRQQLGLLSFQMPDKIAEAIRFCSPIDLWGSVALNQGANASNKVDKAKEIKRTLSIIVARRNKIAHEGDLQPGVPRVPWPIREDDLVFVRDFIRGVVSSIDACVQVES